MDGRHGAGSLADCGRTRFIDPARTSPAAKTQGRLVWKGSRSAPARPEPYVGEDEAVLVELDAGQPVRRRVGADEAEDRIALDPLRPFGACRRRPPSVVATVSASTLLDGADRTIGWASSRSTR